MQNEHSNTIKNNREVNKQTTQTLEPITKIRIQSKLENK